MKRTNLGCLQSFKTMESDLKAKIMIFTLLIFKVKKIKKKIENKEMINFYFILIKFL